MGFKIKHILFLTLILATAMNIAFADDIKYYTTITVPANRDPSLDGWTDTGLDVLENEILYYSSKGQACWNSTSGCSESFGGEIILYNNAPMSGAPIGSLLFQMGDNAPSYSGGPDAGGPGRLYLAYQDNYGKYNDNSGSFEVSLYKSKTEQPENKSKTAVVFGFEYRNSWLISGIPIISEITRFDTRYAADITGAWLSEMGYDTKVYYNKNAQDAIELMNNSAVIVIIGHGVLLDPSDKEQVNTKGGAMIFYDGQEETYLSTYRNEEKRVYPMSDASMDNTKFILFMGCNTGTLSGKWGLLTNAAINNGAESAAGFKEDVVIGWWNSDMEKWVLSFFNNTFQGKTIEQSFDDTADERCYCPWVCSKRCWQRSYFIEGNPNLVLIE